MRQRGRISKDAKLVVMTRDVPPPPETLPEYAAKVWEKTVASLAPGHLKPADMPLLESYCTAAWIARQATAWLSKDFSDEALRVHREAVADMTRLARALRLCPSTRLRQDSAVVNNATSAPKPWEFGNDEIDEDENEQR